MYAGKCIEFKAKLSKCENLKRIGYREKVERKIVKKKIISRKVKV